jgi:hypothetical protein
LVRKCPQTNNKNLSRPSGEVFLREIPIRFPCFSLSFYTILNKEELKNMKKRKAKKSRRCHKRND